MFSYLAYDENEVLLLSDVFLIKNQGETNDYRVYKTLVGQKEVHHLCPFNWCIKPYNFSE